MEATPGLRLGRYVLKSRLGAGGMAEVWEASDDLLRRSVAVKIIRSSLSESPEFTARFLREAQVAAKLQHPNIVPVFDVGSERETLYVVMPILHGGTLASRLSQGVPDVTALGWLAALASALDLAHSRGVIHRDVKPQNVLFDDGGVPLLLDFGLAKSFDDATELTQTGAVLGTPVYMSPEQAMGDRAGAPTDQYALGVLAYRFLTGHLPIEKAPTPVILQKTVYETLPPPSLYRPSLPGEVDAVFAKVFAKKPDERFPSCRDFVAALSAAMGGAEGRIAPAPQDERTVRSYERATPPPPLPMPTPTPTPAPPSRPPPLFAATPTPASVQAPVPHIPLTSQLKSIPSWVFLLAGVFLATFAFSIYLSLGRGSPAAPPVAASATIVPAQLPTPGRTPEQTPAPTPLPTQPPPTPEPTLAPRFWGAPSLPQDPTPTARPRPTPWFVDRDAPTPYAAVLPTAVPTPLPRVPPPTPTTRPQPSFVPLPASEPPVRTEVQPRPHATPRPAPPRATAPPDDPLAGLQRYPYPANMRLKDAWAEPGRKGVTTLYFKFSEDLKGRGETIGYFGRLTIPSRGDVPLLPGARYPILLTCKGLDNDKVKCLVPAPDYGPGLAPPKLTDKDRIAVRASLAGFPVSVTLRVDD